MTPSLRSGDAGDPAEPAPHIPKPFRDRVLLHLIKNHLAVPGQPLILAIQGPMGCGKSFQAVRLCRQHNVHVEIVSGASLSGDYEKAPVQLLHAAYLKAAREGEKAKRMAAILIDDFHLSVAATAAGRQYTVNSQLLVGALMNLADHPEACEGERVRRTPVIVTGNDFAAVYAPLTRHGRMDFFEWRPSADALLSILAAAFAPILLPADLDRLPELLAQYPSAELSFFTSLRHRLFDREFIALLDAGEKGLGEFRSRLTASRQQFTFDDLLAVAAHQHEARPGVYHPIHPTPAAP